MLNSLSQLLLKLTSPGTPDIYQGNEIWDFSLVDPDNRKQVDFEKRKGMLNSIISSIRKMGKASLSSKLLANWQDGAVKMYVTHMVLAYRNKHEELFRSGDYVPLYVEGIRRSNLCSFMRSFEGETCIVLAPRLFTGLTETDSPPIGENAWEDTLVECPNNTKRNFRNIITGEPVKVEKFNGSFVIRMSNALERFPVAVLA